MNDRRSVDDLITAVPGEWKFDRQVSDSFDDHVRKSVPLYDEIQRMIVEMSEWFIRDGSTVYDIGSSTGETISLLSEKHQSKTDVKYFGLDTSASMIETAGKKCDSGNVQFIQQNVIEQRSFRGADMVLSLYTLQFVPVKYRLTVLKSIFRDLSENGCFILVEKVRSEHSFLEDMWLSLHWDFKKRSGLTDNMILEKERSLRGVLVPLTLEQNQDLLSRAGFRHMEVFCKWFNFAGIIAMKSESVPAGKGFLDLLKNRLKPR